MDAQNPLLADWSTPFFVPPFETIKAAHFLPAFQFGMREHVVEIEAIAILIK